MEKENTLTEFDFSNLSENELDEVTRKVDRAWQQKFNEQLRRISQKQAQQDKEMETINSTLKSHSDSIDEFRQSSLILCAPTYVVQMKNFVKKSKSRVYALLGDSDSYLFTLFSSYFFKWIYRDIANSLQKPVADWKHISMENWESENSQFFEAQEKRDVWIPKRRDVDRAVSILIKKRDNGILEREKCVALTEYLKYTNNGTRFLFS